MHALMRNLLDLIMILYNANKIEAMVTNDYCKWF